MLKAKLFGGEPHFDNCEFSVSGDAGDLITEDLQNERRIIQDKVKEKFGVSIDENITFGNRMNLLFIETCLNEISDYRKESGQGQFASSDI